MSKLKKILFYVITALAFVFIINPNYASAAKGDPATANVKLYVYTDFSHMSNNKAGGDFLVIDTQIPIKKGEVWNYKTILDKVKLYGESAIQTKTGSKYTVVELVTPPESYSIIDGFNYVAREGSYNNYYNNFDNRSSSLTFNSWNPYSYYDVSINVFANKGNPITGWAKYTNGTRYYNKGVYLTGMNKVGQTTYLFNINGDKITGWQNIGGHDIYFNETNGGLWTGKRLVGNTTYLFNSQGHKLYGWHRLNGKDYYFNTDNGGMWTGKRLVGATTYLFHNEGYKHYGWYEENGSKYYFDPNFGGGMVTGLRKVGKATYYFDPTNGNVVTSTTLPFTNGQTWNFNNSGIGTLIK